MVIKKSLNSNTKYTPTSDAGLGLVYRLNGLWLNADRKSLAGDFDAWNFVLDRIYCNLSYREKLLISEDKKSGKVVDFKLEDQNTEIYHLFRARIKKAKEDYHNHLKKKDVYGIAKAREDHYQCLMEKDMWLRKFMADLGLYLKEFEYNPATAMFGGG